MLVTMKKRIDGEMNKRFVWNEHTQACQLITIQETEETMTIPAHIPTESAFFCRSSGR